MLYIKRSLIKGITVVTASLCLLSACRQGGTTNIKDKAAEATNANLTIAFNFGEASIETEARLLKGAFDIKEKNNTKAEITAKVDAKLYHMLWDNEMKNYIKPRLERTVTVFEGKVKTVGEASSIPYQLSLNPGELTSRLKVEYDITVSHGKAKISQGGMQMLIPRLPSVEIANQEEKFELPASVPDSRNGISYPEIPYFVVPDINGKPRYGIGTYNTFFCNVQDGKSILKDRDAFNPDSMVLASYPSATGYWNGPYYGLFTAHALKDPTSREDYIVSFYHCENKNETNWEAEHFGRLFREKIFKDGYFTNSILPAREYKYPDEYSGYRPELGYYYDHWAAYFGILASSAAPLKQKNGSNHMDYQNGPVVWPSTGYCDKDGKVLSHGLRHPTSIVHDGYIYLFYVDAPDMPWGPYRPSEEEPNYEMDGHEPGIKVSRAPVSGMGAPGTFMNYYNGDFSEPSLPAGFNKDSNEFMSVPGGRSSRIHADLDENTLRFSVAKVKGTEYFAGVEEYWNFSGGQYSAHFYLRVSKDLVNWSERTEIPASGLNYPIFANKDYTSNEEIDPEDFYIVGSENGKVAAKRMSIKINENRQ